MERRKNGRLQLLGIAACFAMAFLVHFLYDWTGENVWAGIFASANEIVWEHGKILLLPFALWSIVEFVLEKPPMRRFVIAKAAALYAMLFFMIVFFCLYTAILGDNVLMIDILSTLGLIVLGFWISDSLLKSGSNVDRWFTVSVFALVLLVVMYLSFTVNPPHVGLFEDPITGGYGLPSATDAATIPV